MANQDSVDQSTKLSDRKELETRLKNALKDGPDQLPQQIRFMLGLSQLLDQPSDTKPVESPLATVAEARLAALSTLKPALNSRNINTLLKDSHQIKHDELRLSLSINLATELEPDKRISFIRSVWHQIQEMDDPGIRSRLLFEIVPLLSIKLEETSQIAQTLMMAIKQAQAMSNLEARIRSLVALANYLPNDMQTEMLQKITDDIDKSSTDQARANAIIAVAQDIPAVIEQRVMHSIGKIKSAADRTRALTTLARHCSPELRTPIQRDVIKAITQIENEDERAQALIDFAPYMEPADEEEGYTEILENALGVAITLSRRNTRARVLVALAPYLTLDLQGEALAAVHSLSNERERALLLAELAPSLPANMLVASLAVAHTMREGDARVVALTSLAHHAPEHARAQTLEDAMRAANGLSHQYERVTALLNLADLLPPHLLDESFANALESVQEIGNESSRSRALSQLGQYLPANLLTEAIDLMNQIEDPLLRLNAFGGMTSRLQDVQRNRILKDILDAVPKIPLDYKKARTLITVAPHLTSELVAQAVKIADEFEESFDRVSSYIALAQNLPPEERPDVIQKAWKLIDEIDDGYDRSSTLASIAPYLSEATGHILAIKASQVINGIEDDYDRASAITILAGLLAKGEALHTEFEADHLRIAQDAFLSALAIPNQMLRVQHLRLGQVVWGTLYEEGRYQLWKAIAPAIAELPLADCLLCLATLLPTIRTLVSPEIQKDVALILGLR